MIMQSTCLVGYYKGKCPNNCTDVEAIVRSSVTSQFGLDPTIIPQLIRLQFHDCFVRGCDASILLDGNSTEKTATPNLTVRGFNVIDRIKFAVEDQCPGVVSCADIIIMAAREAVFLGGGQFYNVTTGRRDGLISLESDALALLPHANISISDSIATFASRGIDVPDMVTLIGGHTVGFARCSSFKDRLYNFNNTGQADPTMDTLLVTVLKQTCPQNSATNNIVNLDQNTASANTVDNSYYQQIKINRGILRIDQEIDLDFQTSPTVRLLAYSNVIFNAQFAAAMFKLGAVNVLTEPLGEIRTSCRSINHPPPPSR
ncbi:peroxidase 60-like [Telopea speciosissima]|uniref:peroxidase 60-like n=1 Tax=Telopea speciosissima TaxID=54955 RepID=UPI001CC5058D|nr:peroxidase 60-like [Telopea speciosissima]